MKSISPIFISSDLNTTEKFYSDMMEFKTEGKHKDYLIMKNRNISIHFSLLTKVNKRKNNCACYLAVNNIDELYKKCLNSDCVHPNGKLSNYRWGREFAILDPDWNLIKIVE